MAKPGRRSILLGLGASVLVLAACGGYGSNGSGSGYNGMPTGPGPGPGAGGGTQATAFSATKLVADTSGALHQDANLVNGWGVAIAPNSPAWVANNGTNTATVYDGNGATELNPVTIPGPGGGDAAPTGMVANTSSAFVVGNGSTSAPANFVFAGEAGTLAAWAQSVDATHAFTVYDGSGTGALYKGLAILSNGGTNLLLAANFASGKVDVFDANFHLTTVSGGFTDSSLPAGYAPFGIQTIGSQVYVAYAKQGTGGDETQGAGLGLVDIFDANGTLVKRLIATGGALNAPWGMAMAPANFGSFSNDLLVGNFGDGKINVFDPNTGALLGTIGDSSGAFVFAGLWGIAFGNGAFNQPTNTLFYAAGPGDEAHGLYGRIDIAGTYTAPAASTPAAQAPAPSAGMPGYGPYGGYGG